MDNLRKELRRIENYNLEYYNDLIDIIEKYQNDKPDITIETCKAIVEGLSKLVLHLIKQTPIHQLDKSNDVQTLFKDAVGALQDQESFDETIVRRLGTIVHYIGEKRNEHSDISHGRASVKEQISCPDLAYAVAGFTESLCVYMLKKLACFLDDSPIKYEDNEEFNDYLDSETSIGGKLLYSKALFEQDFENYELQLAQFLTDEEQEDAPSEPQLIEEEQINNLKSICKKYGINFSDIEDVHIDRLDKQYLSSIMTQSENINEAYAELNHLLRERDEV